jgi:flagellum-specific peptidoglycan hydrolase FlgJ
MENTFGNFLNNNQNVHRIGNAETRFENADRTNNKQTDNRDTHNHAADGNGEDNNRLRSGHNFEQVLERNFREAFEAEFRQKQRSGSMDFLKKHWFKLGLVVALLFFILKKDLAKALNANGGNVEKIEKVEKQGNKLTITPNKNAEDTPLSIGGALTSDGNKQAADMPVLDEAVKRTYLKRFAQVAVSERRKYGVPASLILANALRQSFAGQRVTTAKLNNHFGLPCTFDWSGASATSEGQCWRQYENAWVSFRDHSVFVTSGKFSELRRLSDKDYKGWAKGLQRLGYPASNDNLANELIGIIEQYELQVLDSVK